MPNDTNKTVRRVDMAAGVLLLLLAGFLLFPAARYLSAVDEPSSGVTVIFTQAVR